jgi:threonyl-tRNA synthetase
MERFIGILIEHHAGSFPLWLAPTQAVVMNITDNQADFVREIEEFLKNQGIRINSDLRNEKIGFKIREHTLHRIPYMLVIGDREVENRTVAVRTRGGEDLGYVSRGICRASERRNREPRPHCFGGLKQSLLKKNRPV